MAPGIILALQALSTILTSLEMATGAASRISATITKAQDEGRDVSDEELAAIAKETDALEAKVLDKLALAAQR